MLENPITRTSGGIQKRLREIRRLAIAVEIALHDDISSRRHERRSDDVQITMAEGVYPDTGDEVVLDRSIGEFDQGSSPQTRSHQWKDQSTPSRFPEPLDERSRLGLPFRQGWPDTVDRLLGLSDAIDYEIDAAVDFRRIDGGMQR